VNLWSLSPVSSAAHGGEGKHPNLLLSHRTDHEFNIFSTSFLSDNIILSGAADGLTKVTFLDRSAASSGDAHHNHVLSFDCHAESYVFSVVPEKPYGGSVFFDGSQDGRVNMYDLRESSGCSCESRIICRQHNLIDISHNSRLRTDFASHGCVQVTSLCISPSNTFYLATGCSDSSVRVFDRRCIRQRNPSSLSQTEAVYEFVPDRLADHQRASRPVHGWPMFSVLFDKSHTISSLSFDPCGSGQLLASYSDDHVYLIHPNRDKDVQEFSATGTGSSGDKDIVRVFHGRSNRRTMINEASFFGDCHIVSGSDDGYVFLWDKHTGQLVNHLKGDEAVVNRVQPHPIDPILATSGIDHDIKLWYPQAAKPVDPGSLRDVVKVTERPDDPSNRFAVSDIVIDMLGVLVSRHQRPSEDTS